MAYEFQYYMPPWLLMTLFIILVIVVVVGVTWFILYFETYKNRTWKGILIGLGILSILMAYLIEFFLAINDIFIPPL